MKMKFKGKAAIPKEISDSVDYINRVFQSKWTANAILQTNLTKHKTH